MLLSVLVVVILLTLAAYQFSELMIQEYSAAQSSLKAVQARSLAESGIYFAVAAVSNPETFESLLAGNPFDNEAVFGKQVVLDDGRRTGRFSILAPADGEEMGQGTRYGLVDEAGKINLNGILRLDSSGGQLRDMLMKLPNMTDEIADAIVDWMDTDDTPRTNGAENSTYQGFSSPYRCKNGPLDSLEELLLVRGVTPQLLFGSDANRNGIEDPGEVGSGSWDPGWAGFLTVYSREMNVDNEGNPRTYLNDTNLATMHGALVTALDESLADFIVLYKTQTITAPQQGTMVRSASAQEISNKVSEVLAATNSQPRAISSRYSLLSATVSFRVGMGQNQQTVTVPNPLADPANQRSMLPKLLDKTTTQSVANGTELPARINVMTASQEVLLALPQLTETDVQALLDARPALGSDEAQDESFKTPAWMFLDAKLTAEKMTALERYVTCRTQVYRVQSIGYFDQGGPISRLEAVFDTNKGRPRILMFRDLTELGRGFNTNQ